MRMDLVNGNPCETLECPHPPQATARGLSAEQVRRLLAAIPETPVGLRDRAIILTLVLTGRRRAEALGMKAGDISEESGRVFYTYRGKGGKTGRRELPLPAYEAINRWVGSTGQGLYSMAPDASIWPGKGGARHYDWSVLWQPAPLPGRGRTATVRRACTAPCSCQVAAGCRAVN